MKSPRQVRERGRKIKDFLNHLTSSYAYLKIPTSHPGDGSSAMKNQEDVSKVYGKILGEIGGSSLAIPNLRWEMAPRSVSGMICGVRIWPLKNVFPDLFGVACAKHTSLKLTWSFQVAPLS